VLAIVHGLGEHSGRYQRLADAVVPRGWSCWAVDLRGMGRSEGRRGHIDRWAQWIDDAAALYDLAVAEAGPLEVVPLGHSFGGVLVTTAVLDGAIRPSRFVLSNPAFRARVPVPAWKLTVGRLASRAWPTLTLANEVDPAGISRDQAVVSAYREDPLVHDRISARLYAEWMAASSSALDRAEQLTVPFLLIVSGADRLIDPDGSLELNRRANCGQQLRTYLDSYHEPFNDLGSQHVFDDLLAWLGTPSHEPAAGRQ
jgi:alpha-beta hydrolase superfamily lysophospholipase